MRVLYKILLGTIILIQSPDFDTKTLMIEEVVEDVYFIIGEDRSETLYIMDTDQEKEGIKCDQDMK